MRLQIRFLEEIVEDLGKALDLPDHPNRIEHLGIVRELRARAGP